MRLRNVFNALTLTVVLAIAVFGQLASTENPFPETGLQEDAAVFEQRQSVRLEGVVTQKISRASHSPSYLFFRMEVKERRRIDGRMTDSSVSWTIRVFDPRVATFSKNCRDCLIDDYTPELQRLDVGRTVILRGYPSKKSDPRLLSTVFDISYPSGPLN